MNDRKFWNDPDNAECSRWVTVEKSNGDVITVIDEHGATFEVFEDELDD